MDLDPSRFDQDEHEKYYFGCSSTEVYDSLKHSIVQCITSFMDGCRDALLEENASIDKHFIECEIEDIKAVYFKACLEELSKFKVVLQQIFSIPPNAPIYKKHTDAYYTEEQVKTLRKEVDELELEFFREKMFLEILKQEKENIDKLKPIVLETKIALFNLKNEKEMKKNEKLKKQFDRLEACMKTLVSHPMKIEDSNKLQIDFNL